MDIRPVFILIAGFVIMAFGFWMRSRHRKLVRLCTAQTTGTVTGFSVEESTSKDDDGHTHTAVYYHPIFEYNAGGRTITKTSSTGSGKPKFKKGEAVTVRYDPNDVEQFVVAEDKSGANFGFYFMMFGALVVAVGIVSIFAQ